MSADLPGPDLPTPERAADAAEQTSSGFERIAGRRALRVARGVLVLSFALAVLAPALASSVPLVFRDGGAWRFPVVRQASAADVVWASLGLAAAGLLFLERRRRRRPRDERRSALWPVLLAMLVVGTGGVFASRIPHKVWRAEERFFERIREKGPGEAQWVLWTPVRFGPEELDLELLEATPPSLRHPLGTDGAGFDLAARVVHGARLSLSVGLVAAALALGLGLLVGLLAGWFGGWVDLVLSRGIELLQCFPDLVLVLVVLAYLPRNLATVTLVIGLLGWTHVARLARAEALRLRRRPFLLAARALGTSTPRILVRHLLPNVMPPLLVAAAFGVSSAMLTEAALSFLGLGIDRPSWGRILGESRSLIASAPWIALAPGLLLFATVASTNLVADAMRDALDPRRGGRG